MKLIVQIPCFNEEDTLPLTIRDIPRQIDGIDFIEILVIDDGSTDRTVEVAEEIGVDHIVRNKCNKGLARTFLIGLDTSLRLGADIIVNTDADNQYRGQDIVNLLGPILRNEAEITIGDRQTHTIKEFSITKRKLQRIGSFLVSLLSELDIPDAVSGFRAFTREAALNMNVLSPFSYTIETIIQAGKKHMALTSVPVQTNPRTRDSRLFNSILKYLERSLSTMIRTYTMYQPLRVFFYIGIAFVIVGFIPSIRFLTYYFTGQGAGHIQSLILAAILLIVGLNVLLLGVIADVISFNRRLLEEILYRTKKVELSLTAELPDKCPTTNNKEDNFNKQ